MVQDFCIAYFKFLLLRTNNSKNVLKICLMRSQQNEIKRKELFILKYCLTVSKKCANKV